MPIGQSDGGIFSIKIAFPQITQITLACVNLTKTNQKSKQWQNTTNNKCKKNASSPKNPSQTGRLYLGVNIYKRVMEEDEQDWEVGGERPGRSWSSGVDDVPWHSRAGTLIPGTSEHGCSESGLFHMSLVNMSPFWIRVLNSVNVSHDLYKRSIHIWWIWELCLSKTSYGKQKSRKESWRPFLTPSEGWGSGG